MNDLVLSLFPGIGILDMGFEEAGFCVVRGPDKLWGGDIKAFHAPRGVFDGVIGGPPCQEFSALANMVRHNGHEPKWGNLIPEFERVIAEAEPRWFVMENIVRAPVPAVEGYLVDPAVLDNRWLGGEQRRKHRFSFGTRDGRRLVFDVALFENPQISPRVLATGSVTVNKDGRRARLAKTTSRSWKELKRSLALQGLPEDFLDESPFRAEAAHSLIGNAVALPMARELARAVRQAIGDATIAGFNAGDRASVRGESVRDDTIYSTDRPAAQA